MKCPAAPSLGPMALWARCHAAFVQNSSQSGGGQKSRTFAVVANVAHGSHGVLNFVVDDGIDGHGDTVFGQDFLGWYVE